MLFYYATAAVLPPPIVVPGLLSLMGLIAHINAHNAEQNGYWREVALSADLAYLDANHRNVAPGCWIVPGEEISVDDSTQHEIRQKTRCSVLVVTTTRNYRISDFGRQNILDLGAARLALKHHIIGYLSPGFKDSLRHVKGSLRSYTDEYLTYVDEYAADHHYSKTMVH